MKIVCISDTHARWHDLVIPPCDLLISAGDYSFIGETSLVYEFHTWLAKQKAAHIISVQGNHEKKVERNFSVAESLVKEIDPKIHFMAEGALEIEGVKIYCSAFTPWFHDWAWNVNRGPEIAKVWARIPEDTELLVTHGPPYGLRDEASGLCLGCRDLRDRIEKLPNLKLHVFGHIHEGHGIAKQNGVTFINAAICDRAYKPTNPCIIFEWD